MIDLPFGGQFNEHDLVAYIRESGRNYIIQGQQAALLAEHSKPHSLDYWLRQFTPQPNKKQAGNSILDDLVSTGLFAIDQQLVCPLTGRRCKGLRLV